ncbi:MULTISPECIES: helix-turn-helix domain-containing protein [unclassified Streptomyces]|uniref:helix-turn-helix domain-containing protein n=1 Tax=unclassified Streptomyces TaxID=2593676 RepID=UPI00224EE664|nr:MULTISPECIES: helix-turn-helix transcriptional regulator [unclassified Streptomyces]WSP56838.1 helix-turn-helix transcriptional regulator [Streptomyces sp. NBC_01241]WSU22444.1 helix-turn-helix transcriptional regulator [Streptomyces sp. NBC_01108]MCX4788616.1 helix-turn-helix transcriptional regulator [Streptomyces sp. NBC_01221]MCX4795636.1 helix-turn-helix transcriptional regulator [Streptomyces sp. NBC_01242]WSJ36935.1 helix-turn-helix transcriptional regulator [Streptomyces sp. NBC_013
MAARPAATARRTRLAGELRKLRERAGMTATEAAKQLGTSSGQLSNVESARFGVSAERVRAMARTYACTDHAYVEALAAMAGDRSTGWWEQYRSILPRGLLNLAEFEHHATALRTAYTCHIPGLLQTADHAREVFGQVVPELSPPEIEHRVSHRIKRQDIIYRTSPTPYSTVVHEAALRMKFGGSSTARKQLEHILTMGEHPHITVTVIPFDAGAYPGSGQSVAYGVGPVPQLDTVHLDQSHGSVLLDVEAQLLKYRTLLDRMDAVALTPRKSRDFIRRIAHDL